jgi:NADH:ubiquinone oxidoreductase subunit 5 (subunit L)/multisubunit Na+/H+ antiporter MnhA subunit
VQTDIKKVLGLLDRQPARATCSWRWASGRTAPAVFHLFTHAFFKALLFLGSGSVIHAMSGEQDMRKMGGLGKKIPITFGTFAVGTAAIAGVPFLSGLLQQGRDPGRDPERHRHRAVAAGGRARHRRPDRVLHDAHVRAHVPRPLPRRPRDRAPRARVAPQHDGARCACWRSARSWPATSWLLDVPGFLQPVFRLPEAHPHHVGLAHARALAVAAFGIVSAWFLYTLYSDIPPRIQASFRRPARRAHGQVRLRRGVQLVRRTRGGGRQRARALEARRRPGHRRGRERHGRRGRRISRRVRLLQSGLVRGYALLILAGTVALLGYLTWAR